MIKNKPFYVIIHHSATDDSLVHSNFEAIRRYHMSYAVDGHSVSREEFYRLKKLDPKRYYKTAWDDIGYHHVIEFEDNKMKLKKGREHDVPGVHAYQKMRTRDGKLDSINNQSIGICIVGNFDKTKLTKKHEKEIVGYVSLLLVLYKIPLINVLGHNEIPGVAKSCPGKKINMTRIREQIDSHIGWLL